MFASRLWIAALTTAFFLLVPAARAADQPAKAATIAERTAGMRHMDGLFPLDYDAHSGKLYLTVRKLDTDFLLRLATPRTGIERHRAGPRQAHRAPCRALHALRAEAADD
jgi:hypothetical protein